MNKEHIQLIQDKCNSRMEITGQQHTHDTPTTHILRHTISTHLTVSADETRTIRHLDQLPQ